MVRNPYFPSRGAPDCPVGRDVTFEVSTGFVLTSPDAILDTSPGIFHLNECIQKCTDNAKCRSINFETGLCVLLKSSAENEQGRNVNVPIQFFRLLERLKIVCIRLSEIAVPPSNFPMLNTFNPNAIIAIKDNF